jgi:hypothetical protein
MFHLYFHPLGKVISMKMDREITQKPQAVECIQCGDAAAFSIDGTYALPRYAYAGSRFVHRFSPLCDREWQSPNRVSFNIFRSKTGGQDRAVTSAS